MIAALYVQTAGVYFGLPGVDPWDEARDARKYAGPHPVVAHPPCGPWSKMRHLCTKQDPLCGPAAVVSVRNFGGVLEHPEHSLLWRTCSLPRPGELPDSWGGWSVEVRQVAWGHACEKPTWLYVVGALPSFVAPRLRRGGAPTHRITSGPRSSTLPSLNKKKAARTPEAFRDFLLDIARSAAST